MDDAARNDDELRTVALRNARSILQAQLEAEEEAARARDALEIRTQELGRSLAMLKATLESTTDAILATDSRRRVTACNENFSRMWQLPADGLAATDHDRVIELNARFFADPAAVRARVDEIYRSDSDCSDLMELADGRSLLRFSRIQTVDGVNVGRVWSFRDITDLRRTEDALREEARVLDLLNRTGTLIASTLELADVLQAVTDAATAISSAAFGAFFYNSKGAPGDDALKLVTLSGAAKEDFARFGLPRATPMFGPTFRGDAPVRCDDVLVDPRYGRLAPHHGMPAGHPPVRSFLAVPVMSRTGEPIGGLFFGHPQPGVFTERAERLVAGVAAQASVAIDNARLYDDARSLARERERLVDAERAARSHIERIGHIKDEFLATLSHELRTPLTAILGWSKVLLAKGDDAEAFAKGLAAIERNARAQAQLIEDLLDMNRIVSGKVRLDVQSADLAAVIKSAVDSARPSAEAREIRIATIVDPAAGPISGDPNRLQQIVWNLLSNAVKFTPKGGRIEVLLERVASHLELTVTDTGIGIPPDFLPQIFDRFRQADSSATRAHGGLGLGLSIVKELVELHGGTIRAHSDGANRGATFTLNFPLAPVKAAAPAQSGAVGPALLGFEPPSLAGAAVLVVDDEDDARELIEHVLAGHGAVVSTAPSAAVALALIDAQPFDVVVSDIGMPGCDGYEFVRALRVRPVDRNGQTPAIALTAFARTEDRTRAVVAGYQMHLAKPIDPNELVATVASLARRMQRAVPGR